MILKVTWKDHFSESRWMDKYEIEEWVEESKKELCTSIGEKVFEDDDLIVLSATDDGGGNKSDLMGIYKNDIIKSEPLEGGA